MPEEVSVVIKVSFLRLHRLPDLDSQHRISPHYSPASQLFQLHLSERIFHCDYPGSFSPSLQLKIFPTPWCTAYLRDGQTCRHRVQGSTGIASTLFKEEAERRQCPAPLPTDLPEAEQSLRKAGSAQKMWRETSLKEVSSAGCFRQGKYAFSPTVNFTCHVAKH